MAAAYTSMQGTVFWMAPEVVNSKGKGYNSKIDIWSVGCVVFEMWTGQRPWLGQEAMAVLIHVSVYYVKLTHNLMTILSLVVLDEAGTPSSRGHPAVFLGRRLQTEVLCCVSLDRCWLSVRTEVDSLCRDPDERPSAAELRKHAYLELQPGWTFNGFK